VNITHKSIQIGLLEDNINNKTAFEGGKLLRKCFISLNQRMEKRAANQKLKEIFKPP